MTPVARPHGSLIARLAAALAGLGLLAAVHAAPLRGQEPDPAPQTPTGGLRVYVGMWSTHILDIKRGLTNNWLVGMGWRGWYGGTFVNSFGHRSFTAGIQQTLTRGKDAAVVPSLSYRLGIVTGYDERFISVASWSPILPMAQLLGSLETGRTGLDLGYAGLVATLGPNFRF